MNNNDLMNEVLMFINKEMDILEGESVILGIQSKEIQEAPKSFTDMKDKLHTMLTAQKLSIEAEAKLGVLTRLSKHLKINQI